MTGAAKPLNPYPHLPVRPDWLKRRAEIALDPELPIIDPHHHLWDRPRAPYTLVDLADDIGEVEQGGHNVVATVFIECRAMYRAGGPKAMRAVGETEFVVGSGGDGAERLLRQGARLRSHRRPYRSDARRRGRRRRGCAYRSRRRSVSRHPPRERLRRFARGAHDVDDAASRASGTTRRSAEASRISRERISASTPGSIIRRSPNSPTSRENSRIRRSFSITSAVRSAWGLMPASATRCSPVGEHRSRISRAARTSS